MKERQKAADIRMGDGRDCGKKGLMLNAPEKLTKTHKITRLNMTHEHSSNSSYDSPHMNLVNRVVNINSLK